MQTQETPDQLNFITPAKVEVHRIQRVIDSHLWSRSGMTFFRGNDRGTQTLFRGSLDRRQAAEYPQSGSNENQTPA